jgi:two-component system LytT family response regulator
MIRCICIDDEPLALEMMEDFISKVSFLQLIKTCKNAIEAYQILENEKIDLIFVDVEMPEINGVQFVQSLKQKPFIIFSTAYKKYALEGFELDVIDYLVKPYSFDRFFKSVLKVKDARALILNSTPAVLKQLPPDYIFVNADYSLVKVNIPEIAFIEGLKDYIKIYLSNNSKPIVTRMSMKTIEERLDLLGFKRIHKSYIVNLGKISSIKKTRLIVEETELFIGDNYKVPLYKSLGLDLSEDS